MFYKDGQHNLINTPRTNRYLKDFISLGDAFLHVSALTMTMSIPVEFSIRKFPSVVKSMFTTDPDTWSKEKQCHWFTIVQKRAVSVRCVLCRNNLTTL